jgi:D-3-phosphoglycerate dehydrogenase
VQIANVACDLGMRVIGFDPRMTIKNAWQLNSKVESCDNIESLAQAVDFITFHVPLLDATRNMINAERLQSMRDGVTILNFARSGIVDDQAVLDALDSGKVHAYICDFPTNLNKNHPGVICLPHLGASTAEAEDNCALMVADEIRDYLENGNITNSVNFPDVYMARTAGSRLAIVNTNVPNMVGQISAILAEHNHNIIDLINKSRDDIAYNLLDIEGALDSNVLDELKAIDGVLMARQI